MADLGETFDPETVPERENNFDPLPAGLYTVHITESDVVDLKSGNGRSLVLTFDVIDGLFQGRKLWDRLNIQHTSQEAQAIAQRALADLFLATATAPSRDSEDLHFKPLLARVAIDGKDPNYAPKNVIKAYKPLTQAAPATKAAPRQAAAPAARQAAAPRTPPAAGNRPWARTQTAAQARPDPIDDGIPF